MKNPIELTRDYLKKVFSDLHNAIVGAIVAAIVLSGGGIYLFAQKIWIQLKNIAQSPTPIWATIICILALMVYIRVGQFRAKTSKTNQSFIPPHLKLEENPKTQKLSEVHENILELLFQKPASIEYLCKTLKLNREEVDFYLTDLCDDKSMIDPPTPYASVEEWSIDQKGREYVMAKRGKV